MENNEEAELLSPPPPEDNHDSSLNNSNLSSYPKTKMSTQNNSSHQYPDYGAINRSGNDDNRNIDHKTNSTIPNAFPYIFPTSSNKNVNSKADNLYTPPPTTPNNNNYYNSPRDSQVPSSKLSKTNIIIIIIICPIAIFVIAPIIAQTIADGSEIQFYDVKLDNISEDNFSLTVSGEVSETGFLPATIFLPDGVKIFWEGTLLGTMPLDPITTQRFNVTKIETTKTFTIANKTAFAMFSKHMLNNDEFTWNLESETLVRAAGLDLSGIRLSKSVTMKGLKDVTLNNFTIPNVHPDGGIAIEINSSLFNPSSISVKLGDAFFDIIYNDQIVGKVHSTNFTLLTGSNNLSLNGRLIKQNSIDGLLAVGDLFSKFITGKNSTVGVLAKKVKPNNDTPPISWLQSAFEGTFLTVILPGMQNVSIIHSVTPNSLDLEFNEINQYSPLAASSSLTVNFSIPFNFPLSMKQISQNITILDGTIPLATLNIAKTEATGNTTTGIISSSFSSTPFNIIPGSESIFNDFSKRLTTDSNVTFTMQGVANSLCTTPVGDIEIKGINFTVKSELKGLQGLKAKPTILNFLKIIGGTPDYISIELKVSLFNPSNVQISTPSSDISFDLIFQQFKVGKVIIPNFKISRGDNPNLLVFAQFSPKTEEEIKVGRVLLNKFLDGNQIDISINGNKNSTNIVPLQSAMESINLNIIVPGLNSSKPIVTKTRFSIKLNTVINKKAKAAMDLFNPLDTELKIQKINANVFSINNQTGEDNELIGIVDQDLGSEVIVIGIGEEITSKEFELELKLGSAAIKSLLESLKGDLKVNVESIIGIKVGEYQTEVDYRQNQVPAVLGNTS
ncbi:9264_t:CDS:2 [Diversispora eburnea]|uniref:9264_t:CDS:1 n=1 Tax=Diversispora eburnea TaxID=1213867 RepID=A0A9N8VHQ6_9GLOM|nr:9264_t:CDS:2 [Diversispora eburnea]